MFAYLEKKADSKAYKEAYRDGIDAWIKRATPSAQQRQTYIRGIAADPESYRKDFWDMLGIL